MKSYIAIAKSYIAIAIGIILATVIIEMPYLFILIFKELNFQEIECKEYKVETIIDTKSDISDITYVIKYKK